MEPQAPRKAPMVLVYFMLAFVGALVLSLLAALFLIILQSPRFFNSDLLWIDPALAELKRLVTVLMLGSLVFKAAVQLSKR